MYQTTLCRNSSRKKISTYLLVVELLDILQGLHQGVNGVGSVVVEL